MGEDKKKVIQDVNQLPPEAITWQKTTSFRDEEDTFSNSDSVDEFYQMTENEEDLAQF